MPETMTENELLHMFEDPGFWVTVAFIFIVGLLWKYLVPMITRAMDNRALQIKEELDHAMMLREEAQVLLAQYQKRQRESLQEAENIIQQANMEARRITKEAEEEVESALKKRMQLANDKIAQAERKALQEVQNHIIDITVAATRQIISDKLDTKARNDLLKVAAQDIEQKMH